MKFFHRGKPPAPRARLIVLRPRDPKLALENVVALQAKKLPADKFGAAFQALLQAQRYRFVGYLKQPAETVGDRARILDRAGAPIGWTAPGDSFVPATEANERLIDLAQQLANCAELWAHEAADARNPDRKRDAERVYELGLVFNRNFAHFWSIDMPAADFQPEPCESPVFEAGDYAAANAKLIECNEGLLEMAHDFDHHDRAVAQLARDLHAAIVAYYSRWHVPD